MGFWERRRHIKEAKDLLRVGAQVEDLHEALKVVAKQGEQWHQFVPHGGWPVLPSKLDEIISTQEALVSNMTALDTVLSTTPAGGNLETADFEKVEARLKALLDDRKALDTLPERCLLEQEFASAGLNELVADLNARRVSVEQVRGEVQLAWWTTVFEDIVRSSAIISNQDGAALQARIRPLCAGRCGARALHRTDGVAGIHAPPVRHAVLPHSGSQPDAHRAGRARQCVAEQDSP